ncbi:MAG: DUF2807 domain-containing protein [Acidimicrobiia bacterium]|nr:DUF2807 domain-containing protein [Acidimicrobiia bacterium]NNJ47918.1 DUF2807 domain-containing protein [Acidimicrobiia bacterium]
MPCFFLRRAGLYVAILGLVLAALVAGCSDDDSSIGPGPGGPVGPVGPVGPDGEDDGIPGSGTLTIQERIAKVDVVVIEQIVFRSEGEVTISNGTPASLTIEADDNLHQYLEATLRGTTLEISTVDGIDIAPSEPPVFRVDVPDLRAVELAGAGTIDIGAIEADRFELALSGVGDVYIGTVTLDELVVSLSGVGTVSLTGSTDRQEVWVAGVTVYDAADLESRTAAVTGAGTGQATIWVSVELEITAADTASVSYFGEPAVTQTLAGLATVTAQGAK